MNCNKSFHRKTCLPRAATNLANWQTSEQWPWLFPLNAPLMWVIFPLTLLLATLGSSSTRAEDIPPRYREVIRKGLDYVAGQQMRDGHCGGNGVAYSTTITSL